MSEQQVCPWCQMEIVWDPEIGPEDECPHCFNELNDYRTLTLDMDEEVSADQLEAYEEAVELYEAAQREDVECEACQQQMLDVGVQRVESYQFTPAMQPRGLPNLLTAPYQVQVFLCPSCFQIKQLLAEEDRLALVHAITHNRER